MYEKILVATDGSTLSKKAVRSAIELAAAVDAELVALYVVPRYPDQLFRRWRSPCRRRTSLAPRNSGPTRGQAVVDAVQQAAEAKGVKAKAVVSKSDLVAEAIMSTAKKNKCDLIVMASHGRKGFKRILLGSETQHVLTHSSIPVLVLR